MRWWIQDEVVGKRRDQSTGLRPRSYIAQREGNEIHSQNLATTCVGYISFVFKGSIHLIK